MEEDIETIDWKTKYAYLLADFENYKKRIVRERQEIVNSANRDVILDLLSIVDDMERLNSELTIGDLEENSDPLETGFLIIYENTLKLLNSEGCYKIKCSVGDDFNVNFHESISAKHKEGTDRGKIVEVYQSGWSLNGKLLRPAKVCVSK